MLVQLCSLVAWISNVFVILSMASMLMVHLSVVLSYFYQIYTIHDCKNGNTLVKLVAKNQLLDLSTEARRHQHPLGYRCHVLFSASISTTRRDRPYIHRGYYDRDTTRCIELAVYILPAYVESECYPPMFWTASPVDDSKRTTDQIPILMYNSNIYIFLNVIKKTKATRYIKTMALDMPSAGRKQDQ